MPCHLHLSPTSSQIRRMPPQIRCLPALSPVLADQPPANSYQCRGERRGAATRWRPCRCLPALSPVRVLPTRVLPPLLKRLSTMRRGVGVREGKTGGAEYPLTSPTKPCARGGCGGGVASVCIESPTLPPTRPSSTRARPRRPQGFPPLLLPGAAQELVLHEEGCLIPLLLPSPELSTSPAPLRHPGRSSSDWFRFPSTCR